MTALAAALLVALPARANPSQELSRARAEYARGEYQRTADILGPQLSPKPLISDERELKEAHYLLGNSYFFLGDKDRARSEYLAILYLDPRYELDDVTEDPQAYAFFTDVKRENKKYLDEIQRLKDEANRKKQQPGQVITDTIVYHPTPTAGNWVPFGIPQFKSGHRRKGAFLLASEALFAGTSLGVFSYLLVKYGYPPQRPESVSEQETIRQLQVVQIGTGAAAIGLYVYGVIDAYQNQPPKVTRTRKVAPMSLVPLLQPGAVGVGAAWEF